MRRFGYFIPVLAHSCQVHGDGLLHAREQKRIPEVLALGAEALRGIVPVGRARQLLERVTQLAPGYADAYAQFADVYLQRAAFGWSEFAQTDVETAIRLARKAIELDEECVMAHGVLARAYTSIQKYDIGLAESERALQINPSDTEALLTRSAVLLWTGRIDESIAACPNSGAVSGSDSSLLRAGGCSALASLLATSICCSSARRQHLP